MLDLCKEHDSIDFKLSEKIIANIQDVTHITEDEKKTILSRIQFQTEIDEFVKNSDLVIEAATESKKIKLEIFKNLDTVCNHDTILATNTSSILIQDIAAVTNRKEKVIGMHFMNPVPIMKLVEVIQTKETSKQTIQNIKIWVCGYYYL